MKILHTADIHIQEADDQRWQALATVLKRAETEKADIVTISGDLFDKDFNATQNRGKIRQLFSKHDLQIIIIPGNHDSKSFAKGLDFGDNVKIIHKLYQPISIANIDFYGLPFSSLNETELITRLQTLQNQLNPKKINILLFHGELLDQFFDSHDFGDEGNRRYLPIHLSTFTDLNIDYVLAGHFHKSYHQHELDNQRLKNGGYFIYPGSPVSITKKETGPRQACLFETGNTPQAISLETPYYQEINLQIMPDDEQPPLKQLKAALKNIDSHAQPLITLKGYISSQKLLMTEVDLREEIKKFAEKNHLQHISNQLKDISEIIDTPLYQTFLQKLASRSDITNQQSLKNQLIQALIKTN